jgi:adenosylmethionine-8-amino-7-oxononanoate aminotransferase
MPRISTSLDASIGMRGAAGLILRPEGNTITFCPSFIIDEAQVDMIADLFEASAFAGGR